MKSVVVFGKKYELKDFMPKDRIHQRIIKIANENGRENIENFLSTLLSRELNKIYKEILREGKIELFGKLEIEVKKSIDRKNSCLAKLKENKIIVKNVAISLPRPAIKYVLAHELSHIMSKKHGKKFWQTLEIIYPNYKNGLKLFELAKKHLHKSYFGKIKI